MKILLLSFYYPPDLSAGSFRAQAIVQALRKVAPSAEIDIITTTPNRYHSFAAVAPKDEALENVDVHRITLRRHQSGMLDQSASFLGFAHGVSKRVRRREYDLVFATSSRLMTAVLGAWVAKRKKAKLYLDIRDIFADNVQYLFGRIVARLAHVVFSGLERYAVARADKINVVSGGFLDYFRRRYPNKQFSCFTNGIDDEFLQAFMPARVPPRARDNGLTILYAGNIGEGQGLHLIVPQLATELGDENRFRIIGDGGRKPALEAAVQEAGLTNVLITPPVERQQLIEAYKNADILFLHLNDYPAFKKVLPSKLFEYAASGKPVWAGVAGFAAEFVATEIGNSAVFPPCNLQQAIRSFETLDKTDTPRTRFKKNFSRSIITERLARDIMSVVPDS